MHDLHWRTPYERLYHDTSLKVNRAYDDDDDTTTRSRLCEWTTRVQGVHVWTTGVQGVPVWTSQQLPAAPATQSPCLGMGCWRRVILGRNHASVCDLVYLPPAGKQRQELRRTQLALREQGSGVEVQDHKGWCVQERELPGAESQ